MSVGSLDLLQVSSNTGVFPGPCRTLLAMEDQLFLSSDCSVLRHAFRYIYILWEQKLNVGQGRCGTFQEWRILSRQGSHFPLKLIWRQPRNQEVQVKDIKRLSKISLWLLSNKLLKKKGRKQIW